MKFIDLFAGIGGFRYGLEKCNGNKSGREQSQKEWKPEQRYVYLESDQQTFHCVWSNEWDRYASQIYKKHFGECDTRDITTVPTRQIPDHDLLCAGFPCQAFSVAGKRFGFEDTRGTLFFEIARIARDKRPRYLLLENVKGLLSHDNGKTFQTILRVLADLGYQCEWQVLNSKHFGVPQNRERVFIIGHLGGKSRRKVFPVKAKNSNDNGYTGKEKLSRQISYTLDANYYKGVSPKGYQSSKRQLIRTDEPNTQEGSYIRQPLRYLDRNQKKIEGDYAFTVDGSNTSGVRKGIKIRRLTPTECERLQGFPDGWTKGISDTQRYKCLGNAVTTTVVEAIGKIIAREIR